MRAMPFDAFQALLTAGFAVDLLDAKRQETIRALTEDEVGVLISVTRKLPPSAEVEGQDLNVFSIG